METEEIRYCPEKKVNTKVFENVLITYTDCIYSEDYETNGFMKPQMYTSEEMDFPLILEDNPEFSTDAPFYIRLSARGFLDCTDWVPVYSGQDVKDWFELYCPKD